MHFHQKVLELQAQVLRIIALGLGCAESFFDDILVDGSTLTRAIHYPRMNEAPTGEHIWAAAHKDINLITALPRASGPGLQLLSDGAWVDVIPPEGHVIVNTGIMLERLTNDRIGAGIHRVIAPWGEPTDRYSVVQFCHPAPWYSLAPLSTCVAPERPLRYGTISAGDMLDRVLYEINLIQA